MFIRLLILLLLPLNALAETWVCTFEDGSMGSYVRKGKVMSFEDAFMHDEIVFEDKEYIVTLNSVQAHIGYVKTNIFNKKHQTLTWSTNDNHWKKGEFQFNQCKVIK
jgi:hypothetical protein